METDPFSRALAALASPAVDPNARREAEAFVTAAGEDPAVVLALLRHLEPASAVAPETRHLAAVLLSTSAGKHWRALDDHVRRATQSGVLAALAHAEDPATLRALAHAADVVAQSSSTTSTPWDELLPSLSEAASSPRDAHREAASLLLGNLAESMGAHLATHHGALVATLVAASEIESDDASTRNGAVSETAARRRARRAALGALAQLASALGTSGDFEKVATLVPRIVERCLRAAAEYSEPSLFEKTDAARLPDFRGVAAALRALAAAVAVDADAVFGPDLRLLLPAAETALAVATTGHVGPRGTTSATGRERSRDEALDDARAAAFEALEALASTHSGALDEPVPAAAAAAAAAGASAKDAPRTIAAMLLPPLCAAARGEDGFHRDANDANDANDDSETRGVAAAARAALRQCALRFPPSVTLPHAIGPVADAGARGAAPSAGALAAFAAVVEGCAHDAVDDDARAKHVLAALQLGVQSGDAATARAAARAAAELTEHAGHALASLHGEATASLLCVAVRAAAAAECGVVRFERGAPVRDARVRGERGGPRASRGRLAERRPGLLVPDVADGVRAPVVAPGALARAARGNRRRRHGGARVRPRVHGGRAGVVPVRDHGSHPRGVRQRGRRALQEPGEGHGEQDTGGGVQGEHARPHDGRRALLGVSIL